MSTVLKVLKVSKIPIFALMSEKDISLKASKVIGADYEPNTKVWYFPAYHPFGRKVFDELRMLFGNSFQVDKSVYDRLDMLDKVESILENKTLKPEFQFKTEPMAHQVEGLVYGNTHLRLGLFWECGTGKTKVAVDITRYQRKNTLFLCPSRLVENAEEEYYTHSFDKELNIISITEKIREDKLHKIQSAIDDKVLMAKNNNVLIVGYETASQYNEKFKVNYCDLIAKFPYDIIFCDESHKLRTVTSKISTTTMALAKKAYRRVLMTGTPSLGNPLHLFVQMKILLPWLYKNYYVFKNTYTVTAKHNKHMTVAFQNLHIIRKQVEDFSIQKTKDECLDLPERNTIRKLIPMSDEQIELYNSVAMGEHASVLYNPIKILINMKLHQLCGGTLLESPIDYTICEGCENLMRCSEYKVTPFTKRCIRSNIERPIKNIILKHNPKLEYLMELLDTLVNGEGKKVIVWYMYENEYKIITEAFKKNDFHYVDYGSMGHEAVKEFNTNDSCGVFLSQIQSSSGITLNAATYTVYYSVSWDLEHYLQSIDRFYRLGQTKKVTMYLLMMEGGLDEKIYAALETKVNVINALLKQDLGGNLVTRINLRK